MRTLIHAAIFAALLVTPAEARQDRVGVVVCVALACSIIMPPPPWLIDDSPMQGGKRGHWPGRR